MSDSDIVKDFLVESYENLDRLDRDLVGLEKNPQDKDALAGVFRTIHTIKGTCGFLGFNKLEKVAHAGENLLTRLRDGALTLNPEITTALLGMVDAVRQMLAEIQATGQDGDNDYPELRETLTRLQQGSAAGADGAKPEKGRKTAKGRAASETQKATSVKAEAAKAETLLRETKDRDKVKDKESDKDNDKDNDEDKDKMMEAAKAVASGENQPAREIEEKDTVKEQETEAVSAAAAPTPSSSAPSSPASSSSAWSSGAATSSGDVRLRDTMTAETIRVGVNVLDNLMILVGELVLARNQLLQLANTVEDAGLQAVSQRMNLIATELQEEVMKTRMQPIGNIWNQFPRTVRDVALGCGKEVVVEMEGQETELDKTIIEAIKDPLTHLVRNSVDHGIEAPEERVKLGKDRRGRLVLRAFHEGGQVNIEISDDGAGLNLERIRKKAVERAVVTSDQASRMSEREIFNLIFLPGFSTAEKVTNVSGRGVGMDVVKTNVEKIGGTVDIQSQTGRGTTVRVKIPLTLAIVPALVVSCGGDRYAIPQVSLLELVRLEAEEVAKGVELVHGAPVYRLRGRLLPLVYLSRELNGAGRGPAAGHSGDGGEIAPEKTQNQSVNIVVLQADDRQFGLVVDEINDTEEIVVKPLRKQLKSVKTFAGSSIMGDGKVALILDVLGLAQRASVVSETKDRSLTEKAAEEEASAAGSERQTFLLFAGPGDSRMAIPLSTVARLEEFPSSQLEMSGSQWVTQYRGQILQLVRLQVVMEERRSRVRSLQAPPEPGAGPVPVLVLSHQGRLFGLVVERILDIVEDRATVKAAATRPNVLYSVVIGDRVTELLDIPAILAAQASCGDPGGATARAAGGAN